jgi:hypothetical protein
MAHLDHLGFAGFDVMIAAAADILRAAIGRPQATATTVMTTPMIGRIPCLTVVAGFIGDS